MILLLNSGCDSYLIYAFDKFQIIYKRLCGVFGWLSTCSADNDEGKKCDRDSADDEDHHDDDDLASLHSSDSVSVSLCFAAACQHHLYHFCMVINRTTC